MKSLFWIGLALSINLVASNPVIELYTPGKKEIIYWGKNSERKRQIYTGNVKIENGGNCHIVLGPKSSVSVAYTKGTNGIKIYGKKIKRKKKKQPCIRSVISILRKFFGC